MNLQRIFLSGVLLLLTSVFGSYVCAQPSPDRLTPSFNVTLQLIVGTNDGATQPLPTELTAMARQLEHRYGLSSLKLADTFEGRINDGGTYNYKSVSNFLGRDVSGTPQIFLEWNLQDLRSRLTAKGAPGLKAELFHFGAHVPVPVTTGTTNTRVEYESIGIDSRGLGVAEDTPTMIGTLNLPGGGGTMFLVMTVRSADL